MRSLRSPSRIRPLTVPGGSAGASVGYRANRAADGLGGMAETRRVALWASLALSGVLATVAVVAQARAEVAASSLSSHQVAQNTRGFTSDGARYAAWQASAGSLIVVLDTATGQRRSIAPPASCELQSPKEAPNGQAVSSPSLGRFLLRCGTSEQAVLSVRTGQTQMLPDDLSRYHWAVVGTDYAESPNTGCGGYDKCFALYDLATGAISVRRAPAIVDLNRPGALAAPLCPALRRRILAAERTAAPSFAYERGLFVHAAKRAGYVEIDRCKRPPIVLAGRGEPRDFDLSAGLLTWDTGYPTSGIDEEGESPYPSVLNAYQLETGRRRSWRLPVRVLPGETRPVVFGYSTHTSQTVFWIADRSVNYGKTGLIVETSSIYSARL